MWEANDVLGHVHKVISGKGLPDTTLFPRKIPVRAGNLGTTPFSRGKLLDSIGKTQFLLYNRFVGFGY